MTGKDVAWRSTMFTALLHSACQAAGFGVAMLAWRRSPGWSTGQWLGYFVVLTLACPIGARGLAKVLLHLPGRLQPWRVWAVSTFTLVVLLFTEGFAEAGGDPVTVLAIMAGVTFFGGLASSWPRHGQDQDVRQA
jgi:hypothetical protein